MSRFMVAALFVLVAALAFGISAPAAAHRGPTLEAGGTCGCAKPNPVCCRDCNGNFAYCARSYAFCPECAAP